MLKTAPHLSMGCLILHLDPIKVNGAELQYHTQPVDGWGAVFGGKQPCFCDPGQLLCLPC